jgi:hypothetical protein
VASPAIRVPFRPLQIQIADLDLDGRPDVVIAQQDAGVTVLHQRKDRSFAPPRVYPIPANLAPSFVGGVTVADLNGDTLPDIAFTTSREDIYSGAVVVLLQRTDGTFGLAGTIAYPHEGVASLAAGYFDPDGSIDLTVTAFAGATTGGSIAILLGHGDGTFAPSATYRSQQGTGRVYAADMNGDAHADLVVLSSWGDVPGALSVLINDGSGGFGPPASYVQKGTPVSAAVADFDHNGSPDVAVAGYQTKTAILLNQGDGVLVPAQPLATGKVVNDVAAADIDGDGIPDLAAVGFGITLYRGRGDGTFRRLINRPAGAGPQSIAAGDLDGDGRTDFVVGGSSRSVALLYGTRAGVVAPRSFAFPVWAFSSTQALGTGDFDGDGIADVAVAAGSGSGSVATSEPSTPGERARIAPGNDRSNHNVIAIMRGRGDGTFVRRTPVVLPWSPTDLAIGDLNGDGAADLVATMNDAFSPNVPIALGRGDGTFDPPTILTLEGYTSAVGVGEATGDTFQDVLVSLYDSGNDTTHVEVLPGKGDGTFGAPIDSTTGPHLCYGMEVRDLDGDGTLDVAIAQTDDVGRAGGDIAVSLGSGTGSFGPQTVYPVGDTEPSIAVGDVNADGMPDLVSGAAIPRTAHPMDQVAVFLGIGGGVFGSPATYQANGEPVSIRIADLTGDGLSDLAIADASGILSLMSGVGGGSFGSPSIYAVDYMAARSGHLLAVTDVDRDGRSDLVAGADGVTVYRRR